MTSRRDSTKTKRLPNKTEKIAACLLLLKRGDDWLIPEPIRSTGSADEICRCVEWHHTILPHELGGDTRPQNITPLLVEDHKIETHKVTRPAIRRAQRLSEAQAAHHEAMRRKLLGRSEHGEPKSRMKGRPLPGTKASGLRRRMNGKVERR